MFGRLILGCGIALDSQALTHPRHRYRPGRAASVA
jgi:hypothetical protein